MTTAFHPIAAALAALLVAGSACAQNNVLKFGGTYYTTHSRTNGVTGVGIPPGADAQTGNAGTVLFIYERLFTPQIGAELVLGIPPKISSKATGTVAFLGDDILSAKNVAPTLLVNYHFGAPGDTWRPYLGLGVNFTRFVDIQSRLAPEVNMSDSWGWAAQAGMDYAINTTWSVFASVAALKVESKLASSGATVLQTTIDFKPVVYSFGVAYKF
jgi:outer membrane protein